MRRKDYKLIAAAINRVRDSYSPEWSANLVRALDDVTYELARDLAADSDRFDVDRFTVSAGIPGIR